MYVVLTMCQTKTPDLTIWDKNENTIPSLKEYWEVMNSNYKYDRNKHRRGTQLGLGHQTRFPKDIIAKL